MNRFMRKRLLALTRSEVVVVVGCIVIVLLILIGVFVPMLARTGNGQRTRCKQNLSIIGKALFAYSLEHEEYSPFDERGPLHSLALLYPLYLEDPFLLWFVCPSSRDHRWKRRLLARFPKDSLLAGLPCSYGYTWRVSPEVVPANFAIVADMPHNHMPKEGQVMGFNVLYVDGAVRFEGNAFCSYDPNDNIFEAELGWSADTDSYIRQK